MCGAMQLSDLMRQAHEDADGMQFDAGDEWLQGRSVFGGAQAAMALAAMRRRIGPGPELRALQVAFVAPVPPGRVGAQAHVLRTGRNVTHVEARLAQGGEVRATFVGVFGAARESAIAHWPGQPDAGDAGGVTMHYVAGRMPAFLQHFRARWREGGPPFSGQASTRSVVDLDLVDDGPCSEAHVVAIADFMPPVALSMLAAPAPGSSLTWMLELMPCDWGALPLQGWRIDSEMVAAQHGYTLQSNRIWAPDGRLAALSRQTMVVFG